MTSFRGAALAVLVVGLGIGALGWLGGYFSGIPMPPVYTDGAGHSYCRALALSAQHRSSQWLWGGSAVIAAATISTAIGAMIGPGTPDGSAWRSRLQENRNAILALVGAVGLAIGWAWVQRSDAATTLAAESTASLADDRDLNSYKRCILARTRWLEGRAEHAWLDNLPGGVESPSATPSTPPKVSVGP